jgi:hypothetical protein
MEHERAQRTEGGELCLHRSFLRLECAQTRLECWVVGSVLDGAQDAGDLALDIGKRASRGNALDIGGVR